MAPENYKDYIQLIKASGNERQLLRGCKSKPNNFESVARKDRSPKNMPLPIHRVADEWFLEKFGYRFRSQALFCTSDEVVASLYGKVYRLFPSNGFSFCWSPKVKDLFTTITLYGITAANAEAIVPVLEQSDYRCDDNLILALESDNEIMIVAERFFHILDGR